MRGAYLAFASGVSNPNHWVVLTPHDLETWRNNVSSLFNTLAALPQKGFWNVAYMISEVCYPMDTSSKGM